MKSNLIQILAVVLVSCALTSLGTVSKSIHSKTFKHYFLMGKSFFKFKMTIYSNIRWSGIAFGKQIKCRVFLLRQTWIVNYSTKSQSKILSNEKINTGLSVVTKHELKCQNELFLK